MTVSATSLPNNSKKASAAFFYGTLMHPKILKRVIENDGAHLQICPAVLMEYTRHKIKWADYPGVIPFSRSRDILFQGRNDLTQEERCVRGTLVTGLTEEDMKFLDCFEGAEYERNQVKAHPLGPFVTLSSHSTEMGKMFNPGPLPGESELSPTIDCETYVYMHVEELDASPWDFANFVKHNAWKWYGGGAEDNEDSTEVDRRRERGGLSG